MLEQLDELDGVQASAANHSGTIVRVSIAAGADREKVADGAWKVLSKSLAKPSRLEGEKYAQALTKENWRGIERIGELSAIEFRTIAIERLKAFAKAEKLDREVTDKLAELAEHEWDHRMQAQGPKLPPHKADWEGQCRRFAEEFSEKAKLFLSAQQHDRLKNAITCELGK